MECDKSMVKYDVDTTHCDDETVKCKKTIMENQGTTKCDKSMVTCETISVSLQVLGALWSFYRF